MIDPVLIQPIATVVGALVLGVCGIIAATVHARVQLLRLFEDPPSGRLESYRLTGAQKTNLYDVLVTCFNEEELRQLCFAIEIEYDDMQGHGRRGKARELILFCERHRRIPQLKEQIRKERPHVSVLAHDEERWPSEVRAFPIWGIPPKWFPFAFASLVLCGGLVGSAVGAGAKGQVIGGMLVQAAALQQSGDYGSALGMYSEVIRVDPHNEIAQWGKLRISQALVVTPTPTPAMTLPSDSIPIGTIIPMRTPLSSPPTTSMATFTPTSALVPGVTRQLERDKTKSVMVYVPAGRFVMGNNDSGGRYFDLDEPKHDVILNTFWMDRTEVTNSQYRQCVTEGWCTAPSQSDSQTRSSYYDNLDFADYPVIQVKWYQAEIFCKWVGKRLPTEAEWERAARGDTKSVYPWGDWIDCACANYLSCVGDTSKVGRYPAGASPYGVLDMIGNVWEWVADWYGSSYYLSLATPVANPPGPDSGRQRVRRGGAWNEREGIGRVSDRFYGAEDDATYNVGFRCAYSDTSTSLALATQGTVTPTFPVASKSILPEMGVPAEMAQVTKYRSPQSFIAVPVCQEEIQVLQRERVVLRLRWGAKNQQLAETGADAIRYSIKVAEGTADYQLVTDLERFRLAAQKITTPDCPSDPMDFWWVHWEYPIWVSSYSDTIDITVTLTMPDEKLRIYPLRIKVSGGGGSPGGGLPH